MKLINTRYLCWTERSLCGLIIIALSTLAMHSVCSRSSVAAVVGGGIIILLLLLLCVGSKYVVFGRHGYLAATLAFQTEY